MKSSSEKREDVVKVGLSNKMMLGKKHGGRDRKKQLSRVKWE